MEERESPGKYQGVVEVEVGRTTRERGEVPASNQKPQPLLMDPTPQRDFGIIMRRTRAQGRGARGESRREDGGTKMHEKPQNYRGEEGYGGRVGWQE